MDPKVHGGLEAFEAFELEQRGANAGERRDVKPYRAPGGALKGPNHASRRCSWRAARLCIFSGEALMLAELGAAVSGEG